MVVTMRQRFRATARNDRSTTDCPADEYRESCGSTVSLSSPPSSSQAPSGRSSDTARRTSGLDAPARWRLNVPPLWRLRTLTPRDPNRSIARSPVNCHRSTAGRKEWAPRWLQTCGRADGIRSLTDVDLMAAWRLTGSCDLRATRSN